MRVQFLLLMSLLISCAKLTECENDTLNEFEIFLKTRNHFEHRNRRQLDIYNLGQAITQTYNNFNLIANAIQNGRAITSTLLNVFNAMNGTGIDSQLRTYQDRFWSLRSRIRDSIIQYWRTMGLVM